AGAAPSVLFAARNAGVNNIVVTFNYQDRNGLGPTVTVNGTLITVVLDTNAAKIAAGTATSGTTLQQLINAVVANAQANNLIQITVLAGSPTVDIANPTKLTPAPPPAPPYPPLTLTLTGGNAGTGSVEVQYGPRMTTSALNDIADIGFRADGQFFGYEGVDPGVTNTAGRLTTVD